jgi:hypothetical protein
VKILILSDDFPPQSFGGAGLVAFNLAKGLKNAGHEAFVVTTVREKSEEGEMDYEGLNVFKIYANYHERWRAYLSLYNPQTLKRVKKIIKKINPEIVHAHNVHYYLSYHCLKLAKAAGAEIFLTAHDAMLYSYGKVADEFKISWAQELKKYRLRYNPIRNLVIRRYLKYVDGIIAVSDILRRALVNNGIKNVVTIHNGIDLNSWTTSDKSVVDFKRKHDLEDKKIVLFGGRLSGAKGGESIVKTMAVVARRCPKAVHLIAGRENGYASVIKDIAKKENILNRLVFTGWLDHKEMVVAYRSSNVVVFPSVYFDPFGLVVIEAMAAQKPVVATCYGGAHEIVVDGETGYIVNPNNIDSFAEKILGLLKDEARAQMMGQKGRERVAKNFTLKQQIEKYLNLYKK